MQQQVQPVINWATNWASTVCFGIIGIQVFYTIVINLIKPDK